MNHLQELLETMRNGSFLAGDGGTFSQPALHRMADDVERVGASAVCFWLGDISTMLELKVIDDLCVLPFKTCWFECEVHAPSSPGKPLIAAMLAHQSSAGVDCAVFSRHLGEWAFVGGVRANKFNDVEMQYQAAVSGDIDSLRLTVTAAKAFLSALHCSNVKREEHHPDAKLQKARAKRGKAPLFSHWTLQLDGKSERGENQGGTHTGPRVHLRRGHPRQYTPGKWTWVQACAVGNKAAGIVHKDYSAGPAMVAAAR